MLLCKHKQPERPLRQFYQDVVYNLYNLSAYSTAEAVQEEISGDYGTQSPDILYMQFDGLQLSFPSFFFF